MWIILGCLAGAMTVTASFLSWIDPSQPLPFGSGYVVELERAAFSAVRDGIQLRPARWSTIEIQVVDAPLATTPGVLLAAGANTGDWHFRVDRDGRAVRATTWSYQQYVSGHASTVCIQLVKSGGSERFTVAQRFGVRALIDSLRQVLSDGQTRVTISIPSELGAHSDSRI